MSKLDFTLDKEKYLQIARTEGANAALTRLYRDTERWEWDTFEGEAGYKPGQWDALREVRVFARELWDLAVKPPQTGSASS
jgi:hypothetical protein